MLIKLLSGVREAQIFFILDLKPPPKCIDKYVMYWSPLNKGKQDINQLSLDTGRV